MLGKIEQNLQIYSLNMEAFYDIDGRILMIERYENLIVTGSVSVVILIGKTE